MSTASEQSTGRVAVITGASSGIGEATARALAARGFRVALLARRADRIQALASELGHGAIAIQADVTDRDSIVAAAERASRPSSAGPTSSLTTPASCCSPRSIPRGTPTIRQHDRGQPARGHDRHRGVPRPAPRRRRRPGQPLLRGRAAPPGRQRRLRRHQVGHQRLVRSAAPGTAARRPRDGHRARRRRDRADRPHHPSPDQAGRRADRTSSSPSPPRTSPRSSRSPSPARGA